MTDKRLEEFLGDLAEQLHEEIERRLSTFDSKTRQRVREMLSQRLAPATQDGGKQYACAGCGMLIQQCTCSPTGKESAP